MDNKGVSVIICCYNSANRILDTLKHLSQQEVRDSINWEIVLVDNASTDNTVAISIEFWSTSLVRTPLVVAKESKPGLSFARQKGIETAKYEFLLFCDDDNWLDRNYVSTVFEVMSADNKIGALGGHGIAQFEVNPPDFVSKLAGTYATGPQGKGSEEVVSHHVYGAGCTYRKSALLNLFSKGFIYHLTGRKGSVLLAGDDHELCYALYLSGYKIWYDDKLKFYHFIPTNRMTFDYIKNNITGFANSKFILTVYKTFISKSEQKRSKIKNSWSWLLLLKLIFFLKESGKEILHFNKLDQMKKVLIKSDWLTIKLFFSQRKDYYRLIKEISKSEWISSQYKVNS